MPWRQAGPRCSIPAFACSLGGYSTVPILYNTMPLGGTWALLVVQHANTLGAQNSDAPRLSAGRQRRLCRPARTLHGMPGKRFPEWVLRVGCGRRRSGDDPPTPDIKIATSLTASRIPLDYTTRMSLSCSSSTNAFKRAHADPAQAPALTAEQTILHSLPLFKPSRARREKQRWRCGGLDCGMACQTHDGSRKNRKHDSAYGA